MVISAVVTLEPIVMAVVASVEFNVGVVILIVDDKVPVFEIPFALRRPVDVNVDVFIDELVNVVMVSAPCAVGYVNKLLLAVASVK